MVPKRKHTAAAGAQAGSPQVNARPPAAPAVAAAPEAAQSPPAAAAAAQAAAATLAAMGMAAAAARPAGLAATATTAATVSSRSTAGGRRQGPVQHVQHQHRAALRHETEAGLVLTEVDKGAHPTRLAPDRAGVAAAQQRQAEAARRRQEKERQQEEARRQQAERAAAAQQAAPAVAAGMARHPGPEQPPAALPAEPQPQREHGPAAAAEQPAAVAPQRKRARSAGADAAQQEVPPQKRLSPALLAAQKKIRAAQLEQAEKRIREAADAGAGAAALPAGAAPPQLHRLAGPAQQAAPPQPQVYVPPAHQPQQAAPASGPRYAAAPLMRLPQPAQAAAALEHVGEEGERECSPEQEHSPWGW